MLQSVTQDPDLAVMAVAARPALPESNKVRIGGSVAATRWKELRKGVRTTVSQALPRDLGSPDGPNSIVLVDLQETGTTVDPRTIVDEPSGSGSRRSREGSAGSPLSDASRLLEHWRTTAIQGDADATFNLACAYLIGWGVRRDSSVAAKWFKDAAERGDVKSQFNLGVIYAAGDGVQRDAQSASRWFRMAAEQGDAEAEFNLGSMYAHGEGIEYDLNEGIKWYLRAATKGHPKAQFNLGVIFTSGPGEEGNIYEGIHFYEQAFENGIVEAAFNIAVIYDNGIHVQRDLQKAIVWYTKSAEKGLAISQHNLAVCLSTATDNLQYKRDAFRWFQAAAKQGIAMSQHNLAVHFDNGIGIDRNEDKAIYWYRVAANQGFARSQYLLGAKYAYEEGVKNSMINAFVWIRYAAEQGHPESQCLLASMYYHGNGVSADNIEAHKWVTLGLGNGASHVDECVQFRDEIAGKMSRKQLERSGQSVRNWAPKPWSELMPTGYSVKANTENDETPYRIIGPIKFVKKLMKLWDISQDRTGSLLGFYDGAKGYVRELLQGDEYLIEGSETEDRIAYLFYIWSVLSELFQDRDTEIEWLTKPEPGLEEKSPMELILSGSITDLLLVSEFVDLISGRSSAC